MEYKVRINKKVKNVHVYAVLKKTEGEPNLITKFFIRIFTGKKKEEQ